MTELNNELFRLFNSVWVNPVFDLLMPFLSRIGEDGMVWAVVVGALALLGCASGQRVALGAALSGLIALVIAYELSPTLQALTKHPRPFLVLPDVHLLEHRSDTYGFPSGHTTVAFAAACGIALSYRRAVGQVAWWGWGLLASRLPSPTREYTWGCISRAMC